MDVTNPKSALEMLPLEAKQAIMSALTDVRSLRSLALTSSSLFHAFSSNEMLITSQVLRHEMDYDVLPEAVAAFESSRLVPRTRPGVQDFVSKHLRRRGLPPQRLKLSDALSITSLFSHVWFFATDFASKALTKAPISASVKDGHCELSLDEVSRIMRTFFRFEIYCNIFRNSKPAIFDIREQREFFFSNFSPWENEQLACVHDFLVRAVSPAFGDITEHDIAWGGFSVRYGETLDSEYIQHLLSLGLANLRRIVTAETYQERYKLLRCEGPSYNIEFLYEGLKTANRRDNGICLAHYTPENDLAFIKPAFAQDSNKGPTDVWRWAHKDGTCEDFQNADAHRPLRKWGYVLWDSARLGKLGFLKEAWKSHGLATSDADRKAQRHAEMLAFFRRRSKTSLAGGRGWMGSGDQSRTIAARNKTRRANRTGKKVYRRKVKSYSETRCPLHRGVSPPTNNSELVAGVMHAFNLELV